MALELWWGSGSPYSWRALLALEYKQLPYVSHLVQFSKQEHRSAQLLNMNPRGRVPVLRDGEYVCYESLAILHYLDRKHPEPALFGATPQETGLIERLISEYEWYVEEHIQKIIHAILFQKLEERTDDLERALGAVIAEARTLEQRLESSAWLAGESFSAADIVVFPGVQTLLRALERREAQDVRARLASLDTQFPAVAGWIRRVEALPGYERTYPPHWRK